MVHFSRPFLVHYFTPLDRGPLKRIYLSKKDRVAVTEGSERYRQFRTRRAELVKLFKELLDSVDQLENAITTPFVKKERKGKGGT